MCLSSEASTSQLDFGGIKELVTFDFTSDLFFFFALLFPPLPSTSTSPPPLQSQCTAPIQPLGPCKLENIGFLSSIKGGGISAGSGKASSSTSNGSKKGISVDGRDFERLSGGGGSNPWSACETTKSMDSSSYCFDPSTCIPPPALSPYLATYVVTDMYIHPI